MSLKKNIRDNLLSERIGEQQLQTDLSKFYKPITETQKATAREITEGLKPIGKKIDDIPGFILGRDAIKEYEKELEEEKKLEEEEEEEEDEEDEEEVGPIAMSYLKIPEKKRDTTFGIRKVNGDHYIGKEHVIIKDDDIIIVETGERFIGTPGLWGLITSKNPDKNIIDWTKKDRYNYDKLMIKTNALHEDYNPRKGPRSSKGWKWKSILSTIWFGEKPKEGYQGEGVVVIPSDPNTLLERLDLLLASQEAGHTGVRNELVSICDELKRQGVLNTKAYKKLNHLIKK